MSKFYTDWTQQDTVLDVFAGMYKNSVKDLINLCQDKIVVFDCDGTLTEFRYGNKHLLPCKDADLNEYILKDNFYSRAKFSVTMKYIIDVLFPEDASELYVVTTSLPNVAPLKTKRLMQAFSQLKEENIYHTPANTEKTRALQEIYNKHQKEIIFIEDNADILLNVEEQLSFVTSYHISCLLP